MLTLNFYVIPKPHSSSKDLAVEAAACPGRHCLRMLAQAPMVQRQAHRPATDVQVGPAYPAVLFLDRLAILTPIHGGSAQIREVARNAHAACSPELPGVRLVVRLAGHRVVRLAMSLAMRQCNA
jgi:hypothetical protein